MKAQSHYQGSDNVAPVVTDIVEDAKTLVRQEIKLAKVELKDQITQLMHTFRRKSAGGFLLAIGTVALFFAVMQFLREVVGLAPWASVGLTSFVYLVVGFALITVKPKGGDHA